MSRPARSGPEDAAEDWLRRHRDELAGGVAALHGQAARIDRWAGRLAAVLASGGRLLAAGNGGSAAEAQHLTAELVGRFDGERVPLSAISLHAETSSLTAITNDYGVEEMFARQVQAHGRPGDVLVLLSTSGESPNVASAARRARERGLTVWALTGPGPSTLAALSDDVLHAWADTTAGVQELHLVAIHALCAAVDAHLRAGDAPAAGAESPHRSPHTTQPPRTMEPPHPTQSSRPARSPHADRVEEAAPHPLVVVVGDVLLDRDVDGAVTRLCPDAAAPVVDVVAVRQSPGGAGLAAVLCAQDARVRLVAPVAVDGPAAELARLLEEHVDLVALPQEGTTRRKTRVRSFGQTVARVDDGGPARPGAVSVEEVTGSLGDARVLLVSDYGAGVTYDGPVREAIIHTARTTPVVWDPHPRGGPPVAGAAVVTPNLAEAVEAAAGLGLAVDPDDVGGLAQALCRRWEVGAVAVTAGDRGAFLARPTGNPVYVPAHPAVGDATGAGDRFAATVAVSLAGRVDVLAAVVRAVAAASAWVEAGGADGFRRRADALRHEGRRADAVAASPGPAPVEVEHVASRLRQRGSLVATGGCFDIVHAGHIATLEAAARLGDSLVVLLNSDESVRRLKGPTRPVIPQADRARLLAALDCVSEVVVFGEDDPTAVLERLRPDVWAKGGDYADQDLPECAVVRRHGGRVVILPHVEGRSTTAILERSAGGARRDSDASTAPVPPPSPATAAPADAPSPATAKETSP